MIKLKTATAALAFGFALAAAATPALAKHRAAHPGYNARAEVIDGDIGVPISGARAALLRACNDKVAPLRDYTWGETQTDEYRACMAEHGQPE